MSIKRDYYPIDEAAKMLGCTVDDLIHLGANWRLDIWVTFDRNVRAWTEKHQDKNHASVIQDLDGGLHQLNPLELEYLECGRKDWLSSVYRLPYSYRLIKNDHEHLAPSKMFIMTADIEELSTGAAASSQPVPPPNTDTQGAAPLQSDGLTFALPHMTRSLEAVFKVMWENWKDPDPRRLPKQINIARELDAALGYKPEKDGTPSRNAKAIAAIIKPDMISGTE